MSMKGKRIKTAVMATLLTLSGTSCHKSEPKQQDNDLKNNAVMLDEGIPIDGVDRGEKIIGVYPTESYISEADTTEIIVNRERNIFISVLALDEKGDTVILTLDKTGKVISEKPYGKDKVSGKPYPHEVTKKLRVPYRYNRTDFVR